MLSIIRMISTSIAWAHTTKHATIMLSGTSEEINVNNALIYDHTFYKSNGSRAMRGRRN